MKTRRVIKDGIEIVIIKRIRSTLVMLYVEGQEIHLCKVQGTDDSYRVCYSFNENYIVVYSRGCMVNQIPLTVEAVYDTKNKKVIPVTKKNKAVFEYMCVSKKGVYTAVVLDFLKDNKLDIVQADEVEDFIRYITAGNEDITKDEIKAYVLKEYPYLEAYMNFEASLSVKEYRKIMDELDDVLRFHIMPNLLKEEYLN